MQKPFDPPRLSIEPRGKVELGSLGPREKKVQHYTFTNVSAKPLRLRVLDLAPGVCVDGPALKAPIPAQASAELTLCMDAADLAGFQARNVRLGTDDPRQGFYYLPLEMRVRPDLTVDGERRDFGDVPVAGSPSVTFTFKRETGAPVLLRVAQAPPPYLEMELREGRGMAALVFTLRPALVSPGVLLGFEHFTVATNAPLQPSFDLYLGWKLHHAVEASPSRVVFLGKEELRFLELKSQSGAAFRILKAEVEGEGFLLAPYSEEALPAQRLELRRKALVMSKAVLVLHFQGEEEPLKVPLAFLPGGTE